MCKVQFPFVVAKNNAEFDLYARAADLPEARAQAARGLEVTGVHHVIFQAVEITTVDPQPIKFKKVDGVSE